MPDDPKKAQGDEGSEVDSVMADEDSPLIEDAVAEPAASPAPQSIASTGLFVPEAPKPDSPAPEPTPDELIKAQLGFQRQMVARFKAREAAKQTGPQPNGKPDPDPDVDVEAVRFAALKKWYLAKKAAGKVEIPEEIAFLRAESAETARQRKIRQDANFDNPAIEYSEDDDSDLFVQQAELPDLPDSSSDEGSKKKRRRKPGKDAASGERSKKSRKVAGQKYSDADFQTVLENARKGKKMPSKPKPASNKDVEKGHSITNLGSMRGTNVFKDAEAMEHMPDQPRFEGTTRRDEAMKQLLASVPTESRDIARIDRQALANAIREDFNGSRSVEATPDGNWLIKGLRIGLKSYQIMGVAFCRTRENGSEEPRGGIMADDMGLGKTLMMLGNIANGKAVTDEDNLKTTLIVASPALLRQWSQEINKHCLRRSESKRWGLGGVLEHRAGHRLDIETLSKAEVVLTTWGEVTRSYPRGNVPDDLTSAKQKDEWWRDHWEKHRGELHRMKFLRVVLDEAQQIKNHKSLASMACRALDAKHRWALTGTPILNSTSEFYSLFKFLREPNTGSFKIFRKNFCDLNDPASAEKLNVFLRKFMVRRCHSDLMFNTKLLTLPKPRETTLRIEFCEIERAVYEIVKNRMIGRINGISKQGGLAGLRSKYNHIWTLLLRLRQLCGHILLVQAVFMDLLEREDFEKLNRIADSEEEMSDEGTALLMHLKEVLKARNSLNSVEAPNGATITETQITATGTIDTSEIEGDIGGTHGTSFRFKRLLESVAGSDKWAEIVERSTCAGCRQKPNNPYFADCGHLYCLLCLTDMQHKAARRGHDSARCNECGEHYTNAQPCVDLNGIVQNLSSSSPAETQTTKGKGKKKKPSSNYDDWIDLPGSVLPSAKTRAIKAQILVWLEEDQASKIIVYTQFMPMIRILEKVCTGERFEYCKYTGGMSHDARSNAIQEFAENPRKKILLASLKAGGVGLNLTMADKVLLLDPWWNSAIEAQAFARVYRIGQEKETELTRLVITNTIDEAMMATKARKDREISAVMNDSKKKEALDVDDLMRLFGNVGEDSEGKPFIFAKQQDGQEHLRYANADSDDEEAWMGNEE